jgi:kumamolisin
MTFRPHFRRRLPQFRIADRVQQSYLPDQVAALYGLPANLDCTGQVVHLWELGGNFNQQWLDAYYAAQNRPSPQVQFVGLQGEVNTPGDTADGANVEVMLDVVCAAVARNATIVVVKGPNSDAGFQAVANYSLADAAVPVCSCSWGQDERGFGSPGISGLSGIIAQLAARGQNLFVAAGDNGSSDGDTGNNVDYPASDPHSIGVGGTSETSSGGTIANEVVWNDGSQGGATGGGYSAVFPPPAWQSVLPAIPGRGVPDVAANADPATGYVTPVSGSTEVIGGTSAAAPLWAGLVVALQAALKRPVGFLGPLLYTLAVSNTFRDITSGNNGNYVAKTGWDPCTGWGTPNWPLLLKVLAGGVVPPPPPPPPPTNLPWAQTLAAAEAKFNGAFARLESEEPPRLRQTIEAVRRKVLPLLPAN